MAINHHLNKNADI